MLVYVVQYDDEGVFSRFGGVFSTKEQAIESVQRGATSGYNPELRPVQVIENVNAFALRYPHPQAVQVWDIHSEPDEDDDWSYQIATITAINPSVPHWKED